MTIDLPKQIEDSIIAKVDDGLFPSMEAAMTQAALLLLERIEKEQTMPPTPETSQAALAATNKPIWERILERTADIPDEVWSSLPTDLAEQHNHYLYGTPKRTKA